MPIRRNLTIFILTIMLALAALVIAAHAAGAYSGNVQSRIYHNSGCRYFNCKACKALFNSAQEAREAGYRACKICKG